MFIGRSLSDVVFEKAYCEYRLNRVESSLKTIESATEQTDKLKELYGQVVRLIFIGLMLSVCVWTQTDGNHGDRLRGCAALQAGALH